MFVEQWVFAAKIPVGTITAEADVALNSIGPLVLSWLKGGEDFIQWTDCVALKGDLHVSRLQVADAICQQGGHVSVQHHKGDSAPVYSRAL
ncbi:hypothetical protein ACL7TT_10285 [Microbulbifer sp. 2304DJ12-6]|uniref:hypothetical protein n=1 Tax=Microbulbifer sp. 2304DJ12-6 TaxID=3233340 RepID=UPI0039AFDF39